MLSHCACKNIDEENNIFVMDTISGKSFNYLDSFILMIDFILIQLFPFNFYIQLLFTVILTIFNYLCV